jgi:hypothetical protein
MTDTTIPEERVLAAREAAEDHAVKVLPDDGDWRVNLAGKFKNQGAAILVAAVIGDLLDLEVEIHGEDGQIREKESHGNDPPKIPG